MIKQNVIIKFALLLISTILFSIIAQSNDNTSSKPKKIFMVRLYADDTMVEKAFKEYFKLKKRNVVFVGQSVFNDKKNIAKVIESIKIEKPDLIYIYGTLPTLAIAKTFNETSEFPNIPIVFTGLAEPVKSKVAPKWGPTGKNVTGLGLLVPIETQIANMKLFKPIKKVATLYNPAESQSVLVVSSLKNIGKTEGFSVFDAPLKLKNGTPDIESINEIVKYIKAENVDLVYFPSDAFIVNNIKKITELLNKHKLSSFAYNEFMVNAPNTVLFGVFCSLYTLGQKTAVKADDILFNGVDIKTIPVEISTPYTVMYRKDSLQTVGDVPNLDFFELAQGID